MKRLSIGVLERKCPLAQRYFAQGTALFEIGDEASFIWFIKEGRVDVERADGSIETRGAGASLGEEGLARRIHRSTARASERTSACGAPVSVVREWLEDHGLSEIPTQLDWDHREDPGT